MIGVFGGTGFYEFLDDARTEVVDTPYGDPSAPYMVGTVDGVDVAFLPRHGENHQFPPHKVNYRANVWGMKHLGVDRVIAPCATGSLVPEFAPGDLVIADQLGQERNNGAVLTIGERELHRGVLPRVEDCRVPQVHVGSRPVGIVDGLERYGDAGADRGA